MKVSWYYDIPYIYIYIDGKIIQSYSSHHQSVMGCWPSTGEIPSWATGPTSQPRLERRCPRRNYYLRRSPKGCFFWGNGWGNWWWCFWGFCVLFLRIFVSKVGEEEVSFYPNWVNLISGIFGRILLLGKRNQTSSFGKRLQFENWNITILKFRKSTVNRQISIAMLVYQRVSLL